MTTQRVKGKLEMLFGSKKDYVWGGKVKNVFGNIQHALSILSHYKFNISFRPMYEFKNIYFWRKELLLTMFSATGERLAI